MGSIAEFIQMSLENIWLYGVSFLVVLTILVFVHEWGHFIIARLCGVRVEVFSIGFGKEIWGFTAKNGTRWKFSMIPLGGYVKMFGDADPASAGHDEDVSYTDNDRKVAFFTQPVWKRAAIVFAGPAINFLFAILILACLFGFRGKVTAPPVITSVQMESPADMAGFQVHDRILEINGREVSRFEDIRRSVGIALDTEMDFVIERQNEIVELQVIPERIEIDGVFKQEMGRMGVLGPGNGIAIEAITSIDGKKTNPEKLDDIRSSLLSKIGKPFEITLKGVGGEGKKFIVNPREDRNEGLLNPESEYYSALVLTEVDPFIVVKFGPFESITEATRETWGIIVDTLGAMGQIISGTRSAKELGGVVRIAYVAGDMAERGTIALITFMALLSINLGLINLFPIPLLDGGHLAMYAVETVKGSPVSEASQEVAFRIGLTFLVFLMVFANLNDILQLIL